MNQRILTCPSALFKKGLTLKAEDWKPSDEPMSYIKMKRQHQSMSTLPNNWKMSRSSSSSLLEDQVGIKRILSSSNIASASNSTLGLKSKSPIGSVSLLDLVSLNGQLNEVGFVYDDDDYSLASSIVSSISTRDLSEFTVNTFNDKAPKQLDLRWMSSADLAALKKEDAFLYYSIPSVRAAAMQGDDVDLSAIKNEAVACKIPSSYSRQSRISCESYLIPGPSNNGKSSSAVPSLSNAFYNMSMENLDEDDDWRVAYSGMDGSIDMEEGDGDDWLFSFSEMIGK